MRPGQIKAFAAGMVVGSCVTAASVIVAGPARADDGIPPALVAIAADEETYICARLNLSPTVPTLIAVLERVASREALSATDTGTTVALAVYDGCPQYVPVLRQFVARYSGTAA